MKQSQRILAILATLAAIFISSHTQAEPPVEQSTVPDFAVDSGDFSPFREGTFSSFVDGVFEMNLSLQEVRNIDLVWNGENVKTNRTEIYKDGNLGEYGWSARAIDGSIYTLQREAFDEGFAPFEGLAIYNPPLLWYPASPFLGQNWTNTENGDLHQMEVINLNETSPGGIEGCIVIRETKSGDWQEDQFFKDGRFVGNIWTDLTGSDPVEMLYWSIEILLDDTTLGNSVMTGDSVTQDGVTMQVVSVLATDGGVSAAVEDWGILFGTDSTADDVESISISFNVDVRVIAYEIGSREDVPSGMYLTISGAEGTSGQNPIPPFAGFTEEEITLPYVPGGLSVLKAGHTYTITHNLLDATSDDPLFNLEALYVVPVESGSVDPYSLTISDDFNAPSLNTTQWTPNDVEGASLIQDGGTLNYVTTAPGNDNYALMDFSETPGYDDTWEVVVDVANTATRSSGQYTGVGLSITALENAHYREDEIFLELGNENYPSMKFFSNFLTNGVDSPATDDVLNTGSNSGSLRISYDGSTKVFSIWVDRTGSSDGFQWELLSSYGIAGSGGIRNTDWDMTTAGSFRISLFGLSGGDLAVTSGEVTLDNFLYKSNAGGEGNTFASWPLLATVPADRREPGDRNGPLDLPNILAFSMGVDPLNATPDDLPSVGSIDSVSGTVSFQYRRATGIDGVTLIPMVSENLTGWQPADTSALDILETGEGWEQVEITLLAPPNGSLFMRLEAQMTP